MTDERDDNASEVDDMVPIVKSTAEAADAESLVSSAYDKLLECAAALDGGEIHRTLMRAIRHVRLVRDELRRQKRPRWRVKRVKPLPPKHQLGE
jgi:hypothetical protein